MQAYKAQGGLNSSQISIKLQNQICLRWLTRCKNILIHFSDDRILLCILCTLYLRETDFWINRDSLWFNGDYMNKIQISTSSVSLEFLNHFSWYHQKRKSTSTYFVWKLCLKFRNFKQKCFRLRKISLLLKIECHYKTIAQIPYFRETVKVQSSSRVKRVKIWWNFWSRGA